MKKLTHTWKQKKPLTGLSNISGESCWKPANTGTKRLGRVAITSTSRTKTSITLSNGGEKKSPKAISSCADTLDNSLSSSFALDLDAEIISAVDDLEAAAYKLNISYKEAVTSVIQPTSADTPLRQKHGSKSGKRRSSSARKSSCCNRSSLLFESVTPTCSPQDKKRKNGACGETGTATEQTTEKISRQPSQAVGSDFATHSPRSNRVSTGNQSGQQDNRQPSHSAIQAAKPTPNITNNQLKPFTEEDLIEIETDISPVLIVDKPGLVQKDDIVTKGEKQENWKSYSITSEISHPKKGRSKKGDKGLVHSLKPYDTSLSTTKVFSNVHSNSGLNGDFDESGQQKLDSVQNTPSSSRSSVYSKFSTNQLLETEKICEKTDLENYKFTTIKSDAKKLENCPVSSTTLTAKCFTSLSAKFSGSVTPDLSAKNPYASTSMISKLSTETSALKTSPSSTSNLGKDKDGSHSYGTGSGSTSEESEACKVTENKACTLPANSSQKVISADVQYNPSTETVPDSANQLEGLSAENLSLSSWGLPGPILDAYHSNGITTMFPWQAQCLTTGNVLEGGNLVYSAPTSAGKTMVAELLMLKKVLETRRKALFVLPFVSVAREKMISLQLLVSVTVKSSPRLVMIWLMRCYSSHSLVQLLKTPHLYQDAGVRVGGFMGSHSSAGGFHSVDVAVCTIEKGNGLINRLMEENRIDELGVVVIDELHMVGDSNRGYLLELLLTKLCYMAHKSSEFNRHPVQIIGMSATLPNLHLLSAWLNANLYHTDFRPVPLSEYIKVGTTIYDYTMTKVRTIETKATFKDDEDHIIPLCLETILGGHSVLIFCPTKVWCEKLAEKIAREFYGILKNPTALAAYMGESGFVKASQMIRLPISQEALHSVLEQLGRSPVGVDPLLGKVVQYGVAYHHAGLTFDERDIIEDAFRQGLLKVLVATSTLSSGVNLPARRVIVRSPLFGGHVMDPLSYKQMAGRAGRKGVDTEGECLLVCKEVEKKVAQNLLKTELPSVSSCLQCGEDGSQLSRSMKRAILEVVVSGVASTPADVARYVSCTLLSVSLSPGNSSTSTLVQSCLSFLEDNEFVILHSTEGSDGETVQKYQPTQLGSAVLASSMSPDEGLAVFAELQKARQCFVLANELHIIYLVTPIYSQEISGNLDWYQFYCIWEKLSSDMRLVAQMVGVDEAFLAKAVSGKVPAKTAVQTRAVLIHRRFYTALALHDLVQEVPLLQVATRFSCNKGQLQSLMQSAATFAGMVTVFCARLGWNNLELLLSQFQQRLTLGVTRELCDLVRIPLLTGTMARMLFNAGYHTVTAIAHALPEDVEGVFRKASPFQSHKKREGESDWDMEQRHKARCIWLAGHRAVSELEAAVAVIGEAKAIVQQELGVKINWHDGADDSESRETLSASRTMMKQSSDSSVVCKESPQLSSRNSSVSSKPSPVASVEQSAVPGQVEGPEISNLAGKNRKAGQTPRSHTSSYFVKSSSRGGSSSRKKTPPSDKRLNKNNSGMKRSDSPRNISFFGQVVVSPPPAIKILAQSTPCHPVATCTAEGEGRGCGFSSTPKTGLHHAARVFCTSENQSCDVGSREVQVGSEYEQLNFASPILAKSTNGIVRNDAQKSSLVEYISSAPESSNSDILGKKKSAELEHKAYQNENEVSNITNSLESDNIKILKPSTSKDNSLQKSSELGSTVNLQKIRVGNARDMDMKALSNISDVDNTSSRLALLKQTFADPSAQENVNTESSDNCFDDSLILNTQTDSLLSGSLGYVNTSNKLSSYTSFKTASVCIPLLPFASQGKSVRGSSEVNLHFSNQNSRNVVLPRQFMGTREDSEQESHQNKLEHNSVIANSRTFPSKEFQPESCIKLHTATTESENIQQQLAVSETSLPLLNENIYTEDLFGSSFASQLCKTQNVLGSQHRSEKKMGDGTFKKLPEIREAHFREDSVSDAYNVESDVSGELIAASDYERLPYVEECILIEDGTNMSFAQTSSSDLHLDCSDRDPEERKEEREDQGMLGLTGGLGGSSGSADCDVQEELAIAMCESFSSTLSNRPAQDMLSAKPVELIGCGPNDLTNSFTMSMMAKAFAEDSFCHPAEEVNSRLQAYALQAFLCDSEERLEKQAKVPNISNSLSMKHSTQVTSVQPELKSCDGKQKRNSSASQKNERNSGGSAAVQNEGDFIPPTPPEENSASASSTCVRRTPLRACRLTRQASHQPSQTGSNSHPKEKKKVTLASKQNGKIDHKSSHCSDTLIPTDKNDQQNQILIQPNHQFQRRDVEYHSPDDKASLNVQSSASQRGICNDNHCPLEKDPSVAQDSLCIIDVCSNMDLFSTFVEEWRNQSVYAISVACEEKSRSLLPRGGIGGNFVQGKPGIAAGSSVVTERGIPLDEERIIVGMAVSWANHDAYYISLLASDTEIDASLNDTLAAPPCTQSISREQKICAIKDILQLTQLEKSSRRVIAYDAKSTYIVLARGLGVDFGRCRDPEIACWLIDPEAREKTLHSMVTNFLPRELPLLEGIGGGVGYGSLGLAVPSSSSGRMRAVVESILACHLMDYFWLRLTQMRLDKAFISTEMPCVLTLSRMDLNGFGFSSEECESQKNLLTAKLYALEQEAYFHSGHPFSLTSTDDIAQVLYLELNLPVNGDMSAAKSIRTLGPTCRGPRRRQKSVLSTSKEILEKLKVLHPLPGIILEWRRISSALTKHVYPLQKEKVSVVRLGMWRIFSESLMYTATGRVSSTEPNLQNIPKDFDIKLPLGMEKSQSSRRTEASAVRNPCTRGDDPYPQLMQGAAPETTSTSKSSSVSHLAVSMRHAFVPFAGGVILTADYSQLELRVIAHLSGDKKLISILNNNGDVFKMIAAQWKNTLPEAVTVEDRQHAKQICYGMLYGIGAKALGEQIGVDENDATAFMESFKAKYTGMRSYLRKTVEQCGENGYVSTLTGRRRQLPAIKSTNPHARAQAERQAVNTTVQGSAADIVKAAMNRIDRQLMRIFPDTRFPHRHCDAEANQPRGAFLVLQLHDELIYEVSGSEVTQVAGIIKQCMETTTPLSVRLPVKIKVGPSWGRLVDMDI